MSKVEWKRLGDCMKVLRGCRLTKSQLSENELYPVYHGGIQPIGYYTQSNRQANTTMIINVGASAGTVGFCDTLFWSSDGCFCLSQNSMYNQKFLFHYLKYKEIQIIQKVRKAGIPTLDSQVIENIELPIVNFNVQRQIVSQLDIFTTLIAKLESELTLRLKQYEFYREKLLNFDGDEEVEWKALGSIAHVERGNGVQKSDFVEANDNSKDIVGCIHYGQIYQHYTLFAHMANRFVSKSVAEKAKIAHTNDIIMTSTSENVEDICKCVVWLGKEDIAVSSHAVIITTSINPKYFAYYTLTYSFFNEKKKYARGAKVVEIKKEQIESILIPVPKDPNRQQQIVSQLDTFEQLIAALKREIALRRKQYEFYREKLLTFE